MDILCFHVEWFDNVADIIRKYYLNYYKEDDTLELIDKKTNKPFLKRIEYEQVTLKQLYIGAVITIYSRQISIVDFANEHTQRSVQGDGGNIGVLILPNGYDKMGKVIQLMEKHDMNIVQLKMIRMSMSNAKDMEQYILGAPSDIALQLSRGESIAMEVARIDEHKTRQWMSVLEQAGYRSIVCMMNKPDVLFESAEFLTTAVFDNCSTCVIRPRILQDGQLGQMVHDILQAGFEISAMEMFRLDISTTDQFFDVYKPVLNEYQEMVRYMASAPCVVLEVRGPNVVDNFREFCGPFDVHVAKQIRPDSLRAKYGKTNLLNAVHCTDCPEDGILETNYFFQTLQMH